MRILHVVHQYPPENIGGTELYTQSLLAYLRGAGHAVSVFYPSGSGPADPVADSRQDDGIRIYRHHTGERSRTQVFLSTFGQVDIRDAFADILVAEQPDVVHIQHLMGLPASLAQLLQARSIPYVVTLHDYWYGCANAQLITNYDQTICAGPDRVFYNCGRCALARAGSPVTKIVGLAASPLLAYRQSVLASVLAGARRVIAPSEFVAQMYRRLGLVSGDVEVVPHGISVPDAQPTRATPGESLGGLHIGYLGNLAWQKGVHVLIEAVNGLPEKTRLSIYGGLDAFPDYVARLRRLARHPGIAFHGALSRRDLWPALAQLDLLVVPSLWHETSSLVVQEAYACGVPVVATRVGALPEKIHHGVDGLLVPPGDASSLRQALARLTEGPGSLAELRGNIGPVRTLEEHGAEVEAIYRAAFASGR